MAIAMGLSDDGEWARPSTSCTSGLYAKDDVCGLVPALCQCTSLEHLAICKGTLGAEAAGKLVASLGNPAGLVHLKLSRNVTKTKDREQPALALAQCSALTHKDLGFNQISDDVGALVEACWALRLLDLGKNGIGPEGCGRLGRALIQHASARTHLDLARKQLRAQGADMLASAIGQCPSLTHLYLSFNKIGGQAAGRLTGQLIGRKDTFPVCLSLCISLPLCCRLAICFALGHHTLVDLGAQQVLCRGLVSLGSIDSMIGEKRERQRERETDTETDTQTERQRD